VASAAGSPAQKSFSVRCALWLWGFVLEHAIAFVLVILVGLGLVIRWIVRRLVRWRRI
jgi:hypothetical protein